MVAMVYCRVASPTWLGMLGRLPNNDISRGSPAGMFFLLIDLQQWADCVAPVGKLCCTNGHMMLQQHAVPCSRLVTCQTVLGRLLKSDVSKGCVAGMFALFIDLQ